MDFTGIDLHLLRPRPHPENRRKVPQGVTPGVLGRGDGPVSVTTGDEGSGKDPEPPTYDRTRHL